MTYPFKTDKYGDISVMDCLLKEYYPRVVIIGGPGKGKSTLGQQLAQVHRAKLLGKEYNFEEPKTPRIPFCIVLKYFAQWLANNPEFDTLEAYIAVENINKLTSRPNQVSPKNIQHILSCRPCLLILDGLDEVVVPELQNKMLGRIQNFLSFADTLNANLMIVATSRPKEFDKKYTSFFNSKRFLHLDLVQLSSKKVQEYAEKWIVAKRFKQEEQRIISTLEECQHDNNTCALLTSPLYVTIILLIITKRGRPPSQREDLFYRYWEVIFAREKSKDKGIIQSDESTLFALHAYLGYILHLKAAEENVQSRFTSSGFRTAIYDFLRQQSKRSSSEVINSKMEKLLRDGDRLVLITESNDLFGFDIRSFQEFFASAYLVENAEDTSQRFERLKNIIYLEHWRNVALFFVGRIARSFKGEASKILRMCKEVDQEKRNHYLRPGAWFTIEVSSDGAFSNINPDLQYDFIEYGFKILETGLTQAQTHELKSFIQRLSQEDISEHLRPVLEEKLRSLPDSCLKTALELYGRHFETNQVFKDKIDALLHTNQVNNVVFALNLALRYKSDPLWMAERLQAYWDNHNKIFNQRLLINDRYYLWFHVKDYAEELLKAWSPTATQANELAEIFFINNFSYRYHMLDSKSIPTLDLIEPNTVSEQLILLLKCLRLISYYRLYTYKHTSELLNEYEDFGVLHPLNLRNSLTKQNSFTFFSNDLVDFVNKLLNRYNLIPSLRVILWCIYLIAKEPELNDIYLLFEQLSLTLKTSVVPRKWWNHINLNEFYPLLSLSLELHYERGQDISKLLDYLDATNQAVICNKINESITNYLAKSKDINCVKRFVFAIETQTSLSEILPSLVPLASKIGITIEDLLEAHVFTTEETRHLTFQGEQINEILRAAEDAIEQDKKLERLLWHLCDREWSIEETDIFDRAKHLLKLMLAHWSSYSGICCKTLIVIFFLKLSAYTLHEENMVSVIFTILTPTLIWEMKQYLDVFIVKFSTNELPSITQWLLSFTNHDNEAFSIGSAFVLKCIAVSLVRHRVVTKEDIREIIKFEFNLEIALKLVNSGTKNSLIGIDILSISNYPIDDIKYREMLLKNLQSTRTIEQEQAWANMLKEIPIKDEKVECGLVFWKKF